MNIRFGIIIISFRIIIKYWIVINNAFLIFMIFITYCCSSTRNIGNGNNYSICISRSFVI